MNALPTPSVEQDAQVRAFRTFAQGLTVDVFAAIAVALTAAVAGGIEWTSAYWVALGLAVSKSVIVAIVSYLARRFVPPANAPTTRGVGA
jgi:hypothetical protein